MAFVLPREHERQRAAAGAERQQRHLRQVGEDQDAEKPGGDGQGPRIAEELRQELRRQVGLLRAPRDDQAGGERNEERRHLADQAVADRQLGVDLGRFGEGHALLDHADHEAAEDVDERDDDAGDRVAADELAGTVHRPVEVGLLRDLLAAALGLGLVDDAGVQVGVDRHLLAGHGVQGEPGGDFADARGALGDHDELNHEDDDEDDDADDERSPVTNSPNALMTSPAASILSLPPCVRISRVVATFSTSRTSVVASSSDGKTVNSSGVRT